MNEIATSTVGMTTYNLLAVGRGARTFDEIVAVVKNWAHESRVVVPGAQISAALVELVRRGLVREIAGLYDVVDARRRIAASRDRGGDGWTGWRSHSMALLEDLTR